MTVSRENFFVFLASFMLSSAILAFVLVSYASAADVPLPDTNASGWLKMLYDAATQGEWKIVAGLVTLGLTFVLRTYGSKYIKWFASTTGGMVLSFAVSIGGTFGLAYAAGASISLATVTSALAAAAAAAGLWEWLKHYLPAFEVSNTKTKEAATLPDMKVVT